MGRSLPSFTAAVGPTDIRNGWRSWRLPLPLPVLRSRVSAIGSPRAPHFPVGFRDACAGVWWLTGNAGKLDIDPKRVFVGGHSAGGHYAALMALTELSEVVPGCLPISGVYDFGPESGLATRPRFLGVENSGNEIAASPILHIGDRPCPFLISYGSEDFPHLMKQAERMERALRAKNADVQHIVLRGCNHFSASYVAGDAAGPWVTQAVPWIATH
jgi:arylformamidase